ncbi:hypothetical protein NEF87_004827 [Candidatus Lokiarchaeum ossiferum]|uniref:Uncharacterized protein n=1 Tax=Candidatus Lokiarchaeum ossiferum TaxID=2951803 RepID=A0ABY6HYE5_9ARCH|nr:hypothetical protein NEF87_004827 [Candidatus Lokiarchaeum sp. B-35]
MILTKIAILLINIIELGDLVTKRLYTHVNIPLLVYIIWMKIKMVIV